MTAMNEESLRRANAFLAAIAERIQPGETLEGSPGDIGRLAGLPDALSAARAVRALLARRRLEVTDGKYRLLEPRPLEPGEPEAIPRAPRKRRKGKVEAKGEAVPPGRATYSEIGQAAVDKLVELAREVGQLRGTSRLAREESRSAKESQVEAERRAQSLSARVKDLEGKLEMAETNLRTLLAAARGQRVAAMPDAVGDAEMEAILGVLRANQ
jgi:hypothetical protein